jgi:DNA-directed RNA polymerase
VRWLPNFVHPLDAAHLLRTVNAAVAGGISAIATAHDSFACLPSRAARFRQLIQEEFVRMYQEHDVLAEVYEHARADLSDPVAERVPSGPPQKGSLQIEQLLKARRLVTDLADGPPITNSTDMERRITARKHRGRQ